ncbi:MAG: transposase [Hungatella sp.]|nr:transposase [Hungatella sp.]
MENGSYECIVTNLPSNEFSTEDIKRLYFTRWGLETSFRKLK